MPIISSKPDYISVAVECTHCNTKQIVRVATRAGFAGMRTQTIKCIECQKEFEAASRQDHERPISPLRVALDRVGYIDVVGFDPIRPS